MTPDTRTRHTRHVSGCWAPRITPGCESTNFGHAFSEILLSTRLFFWDTMHGTWAVSSAKVFHKRNVSEVLYPKVHTPYLVAMCATTVARYAFRIRYGMACPRFFILMFCRTSDTTRIVIIHVSYRTRDTSVLPNLCTCHFKCVKKCYNEQYEDWFILLPFAKNKKPDLIFLCIFCFPCGNGTQAVSYRALYAYSNQLEKAWRIEP